MKNTKNTLGAILALGLAISANTYADSPHWTYAEQDLSGGWGAIEGTGTPVPLNYPYAECAIGARQTPVDIGTAVKTPIMNAPSFNWQPFAADFYNTGHAIQVQPADATTYTGTTKIGRDVYPLVQAHLHSPSEHTINGKKFDAEMHFVHARSDGHVTVVGLLIKAAKSGVPNAQIQLMLDNTQNIPDAQTHNPTDIVFDPAALLPKGSRNFFAYSGSLTTPPCTEGVNWYVYEKPITMSSAQLEQLRTFYSDNDRDTQALNGRQVLTNR